MRLRSLHLLRATCVCLPFAPFHRSSIQHLTSLCTAAFAVKFYANEMAFANTSTILDDARTGLNTTSQLLRTWHEHVLYGSSTVTLDTADLDYNRGTELPAYRASALVESVGTLF